MTFKPPQRGPQTGAPPSLEFVALDRLQVDPAYQRATDGPHSRKIIVAMVKEWKWALCQPLVVARREDSSLWILDGQHRHAGALERGDIAHLPCVVLPAIGTAQEARAFVDLNTQRQKLSQMDIFCGMLAAGDESAKATAELIEETGWRVVRTKTTKHWKPGDLVNAPAIASHLRVHGAATVRNALLTLRQAYPDEVVTAPANLINALVEIYRPGGNYADARPVLTSAMAKFSAESWIPRAQRLRLDFPATSIRDAVVELLLDAAGLEKRRQKAPAAGMARSAPPAAGAAAPAAPAGPDGRTWCEQCEARVSPASAASCASPFCKAKARAA